MRTVDPAKHEAKRRHILATAGSLFARQGFDKTTVADICKAAGISSGSLFHYFPTKRAIFTAIFETDGKDVAERLAAGARSGDPWAAVLSEVDAQIGVLTDRENAGLVVEVMVQAGRDPEFAAAVIGSEQALRSGLHRLYQLAVECGQTDPEIDPERAANWTIALIDATFLRASSDPDFDAIAELPTLRLMLARFLRAELAG